MSEKGQIVIPRDIQKSLGIQKGDRLVITTKNKKILLQKAVTVEKHIEDDFDDLLKYTESSLGKLWDNKKDDIWEAYMR